MNDNDTVPSGDARPGGWSEKMEILIPIGFLAVWLILQIWVLPRVGVPT